MIPYRQHDYFVDTFVIISKFDNTSFHLNNIHGSMIEFTNKYSYRNKRFPLVM
jgi:hypothetical protein